MIAKTGGLLMADSARFFYGRFITKYTFKARGMLMGFVKGLINVQIVAVLIAMLSPVLSFSAQPEFLPFISLSIPANDAEREYLGLTEKKDSTFLLSDVDTDILLIEIFNMYCPYCQAEASKVNELYQLMKEQEQGGIRMRIVGLGVSNTEFEVNYFKQTFNVEFPLFSDKDMSMFKLLGGKHTPDFIGCLLRDGQKPEIVLRESGGFDTAEEFLGLLLQRAGYR